MRKLVNTANELRLMFSSEGLVAAPRDLNDVHRVSAYGVLPLTGSGSVLTVTVEALKITTGGNPLAIGGRANEGAIPLRVGSLQDSK